MQQFDRTLNGEIYRPKSPAYRTLNDTLKLYFGSHTKKNSPTHSYTYPKNTVLLLDSESPNGNVWFIDPFGDRGKIECGSAENLIKRKMIAKC